MFKDYALRRRSFAITAISASLFAASMAHAADQRDMVKDPISKLVELQWISIELGPPPVAFGSDTPLGVATSEITLQVRNAGFSPITSIVPSLTAGASDFMLKNDCLSTLALPSSAKNGMELVPIIGAGMAPDATLSANTFSATQIRETSSSTLALGNPSTAALCLTPAPLTGDFSVASGSCGPTLAAGANCTYAVDFTPTTPGTKTATFKVTLGVGSSSFERSAKLQGFAQAPAGSLSASDFGASLTSSPVLRDATVTNAVPPASNQ